MEVVLLTGSLCHHKNSEYEKHIPLRLNKRYSLLLVCFLIPAATLSINISLLNVEIFNRVKPTVLFFRHIGMTH